MRVTEGNRMPKPTKDVGDSSSIEHTRRDLPHPGHHRRKFRDWRGELPDTRADEGKCDSPLIIQRAMCSPFEGCLGGVTFRARSRHASSLPGVCSLSLCGFRDTASVCRDVGVGELVFPVVLSLDVK